MLRSLISILLIGFPILTSAVVVDSTYNATQPEVSTCRFYFDTSLTPTEVPVVRDSFGDKCSLDITNAVGGTHAVYAEYCAVDPNGIFPERCSVPSNSVSFTAPTLPGKSPSGLSVHK